MTTQERNINIAYMLGWKEATLEYKLRWLGIPKERLERANPSHIPILIREDKEPLFTDSLCWDTNWNWLMEAVEFIEKKGYTISITEKFVNIMFVEENIGKSISSRYGYTKIEAVFLAVSDFAKFYNEGEL